MDDIAKAAGYSKATLYVYFENKEEIVSILVLDSMKKLYNYISSALAQRVTTKERYDLICCGLVAYQEEFPFYFKMVLDKININFESSNCIPEEKETYQVGEEINDKIKEFLLSDSSLSLGHHGQQRNAHLDVLFNALEIKIFLVAMQVESRRSKAVERRNADGRNTVAVRESAGTDPLNFFAHAARGFFEHLCKSRRFLIEGHG